MKNSYVDSVFSVIQDNPSVAAGTCTFAVAFALVAGNAFYAQKGVHPDPIWATRDATITQSVEPAVRPVKTSQYKPKAIPVPSTRAENISSDHDKPQKSQLLADIQALLKRTRDYSGDVDGLMGPMTRSAIKSYQKRNRYLETGEPSQALLSRLNSDLPQIASSRSDADPLSKLISGSNHADFDSQLVEKIQLGLAKSNYKDIAVDGVFGSKTKAAIEDFQRRNKLKVTGRPDENVLKKLKKLGAFS